MTLWSDGKTSEEIQKLSEVDGNSVAYNLHEDLLCVKEDLAKANERVRELEQENALLKEHKHDAYYVERNWNELHGDES